MFKLSPEDSRQIGLLLRPSWLSGLVAIVVGLIISVGVVVSFEVHNSLLQQHLVSYQDKPQPALTAPGQSAPASSHSALASTWPLFLVWSLVGFLVYMMVASIVRFASEAEDLRESLDYVNARPQSVIAATAEHALLRVVAGILLVSFTVAMWKQIIPYSITTSLAGVSNLASLDGGFYALLSFLLIAVSLHVETILLRMSLARARVFSF